MELAIPVQKSLYDIVTRQAQPDSTQTLHQLRLTTVGWNNIPLFISRDAVASYEIVDDGFEVTLITNEPTHWKTTSSQNSFITYVAADEIILVAAKLDRSKLNPDLQQVLSESSVILRPGSYSLLLKS